MTTLTPTDVKRLLEFSQFRMSLDRDTLDSSSATVRYLLENDYKKALSEDDLISNSIRANPEVLRVVIDFIDAQEQMRKSLQDEFWRLEQSYASLQSEVLDTAAKQYDRMRDPRGTLYASEDEPAQLYETVIHDEATKSSFFFCTVPERSLPQALNDGGDSITDISMPESLCEQLNLRTLVRVEAEELPQAIRIFLDAPQELYEIADDPSVEAEKASFLARSLRESGSERLTAAQRQFATYLTEAPIVPFEQSPLEPTSLLGIVTRVSGTGIGAYIGFVVVGSSPLLLITVPAGMVICGAASGLAHGLEDGLRNRIRDLLKNRQPRKSPAPKRPKS
ncbi:hypothetical protein [Paraburkholderia acidiphila]|uniref:Uncharacterized protein n=1 Tax=Paraburkholderia acidiphila TaxID=2571747 RepID=A0A7Z2JBK8_9BURK|nr:hypothetical protein [Paraburkholderia acidiphila]QGZ59107.1 hypothetical protein FAZ97_29690 [Paraburkholderia acidiphila]